MPDWYESWVARHVQAFGLSNQDCDAMMSWCDRYLALGYTAHELNAATDSLIANPGDLTTSFVGRVVAHLTAIERHIRLARSVNYRREVEANYQEQHHGDQGACTRCGGSGRVVVPHLLSVVDNVWRPIQVARGGASYYTQAVLCSCALGHWFGERTVLMDRDGKQQRMMSLEHYQALNPFWQGQIARREQEEVRLARIKIREDQHRSDATRLDATLDQLRVQFGLTG